MKCFLNAVFDDGIQNRFCLWLWGRLKAASLGDAGTLQVTRLFYRSGWKEEDKRRRRERLWNGDSKHKQILMSNDRLAFSAAWEEGRSVELIWGSSHFEGGFLWLRRKGEQNADSLGTSAQYHTILFQHHPKVRDEEFSFTPIFVNVSEVVVISKHSGGENQSLCLISDYSLEEKSSQCQLIWLSSTFSFSISII